MSFTVPHIDASEYPKELQAWLEFEELVFHLNKESLQKIVERIPSLTPLWREAAGSLFIEAAKLNTQYLHEYVDLWKKLNLPIGNFNFCNTFANEILPEGKKHGPEELKFENFTKWETSPLHLAILNDDLAAFEANATGDTININGRDLTYIDAAARFNSVKIFNKLIADGKNIEDSTCRNAARGGNFDIVKKCFESGHSLTTCMEDAIIYHNYEVCNWIIDNCGADEDLDLSMNSVFSLGAIWFLKAYDFAPGIFFPEFARYGIGPVVEYFITLDMGLDGECEDNTALTYALGNNRPETVRCLIEHGASIEFPDDEYECPLTYAVRSSNIDLVKMLVEKGVNIHRESDSFFNALRDQPEILKYLIGLGLDVKELHDGTTFLHQVASINPKHESYILKNVDLICQAVNVAIENGANKEMKNESGKTPLEVAKEKGVPEIIASLQ